MIKIENIVLTSPAQWKAVIRGMRNPMNSWNKSDSYSTHVENPETGNTGGFEFFIGENDMKLMKTLVNAGSDDRKFLRMIPVWMDVTAPLYYFKEMDTYKVGTVSNSCSTMHKIHSKEFTLDDFSHEHLITPAKDHLEDVIRALNDYRDMYLKWDILDDLLHKAFDYDRKNVWWQMIQLLPSSYNQKRTVFLNFEVLLNMYHARKNHKLDEWRKFCKVIEEIPYFKEICLSSEPVFFVTKKEYEDETNDKKTIH